MHIELTFMEGVGLVVIFVGAVWTLLKITAGQFNKGLDARFASAEALATERAVQQDRKLAHLDSMVGKIQTIENDNLKRHADYVEKFCTKVEMQREADVNKRALEQIFMLLREISDKLSNKVSREECDGCNKRNTL